MATSLIKGLLAKGAPVDSLWAADIDTDKLEQLAQETGINIGTNGELAGSADVLVLAVKPQAMESVCRELAAPLSNIADKPLLISIAAGIGIEQIHTWLDQEIPTVRCMPNTPALVGKGASGLYAHSSVNEEQRSLSTAVIEAVGLAVWVSSESDIDIVTAVSGSGPAYFFLFMEAMQQAAIELGLDAEHARRLTLQTALGAAVLASESDDTVNELRRRVTSPGGTTEQAIQSFEDGELRVLVEQAMRAAHRRSIELAEELGN